MAAVETARLYLRRLQATDLDEIISAFTLTRS